MSHCQQFQKSSQKIRERGTKSIQISKTHVIKKYISNLVCMNLDTKNVL